MTSGLSSASSLSNGFAISVTNYKKADLKLYTMNRITEGMALDYISRYEQGFIIGTGIKFNNYSMEIRYEKGNGMSKFINLNSSTTRCFCLLGYRF